MNSAMHLTTKEFEFSAAHKPGAFADLHGHSFRVELAMAGEPHPVFGWAQDPEKIEDAVGGVRRILHDQYLNEIDGLSIPTLENVARWIWNRLVTDISGLQYVIIRRGPPGQSEGCLYSDLGETVLAPSGSEVL